MSILNQGSNETISLAAGQTLSVAAGAGSSGTVFRLGNNAGDQSQGSTSIAAGESKTFGPYGVTARLSIACDAGSLTVGEAAQSDPVGSDVAISASYALSNSYQPIAADLELDADAGTSEAGDTAFLAPVMGNLLGDTLTKENNYLAGVIGALSVLGARASVLPVAAVLGVLMDGAVNGDAIVLAHIDGGDPSTPTSARAAFGVSQFNNHASSGVEYGLDLYYAPGTEVNALLSGTAKPFTPSKADVHFHNGLWFVALDTAITANSTTTSAPVGSIGITSHATGRGKLFMSDGTKWQFAVVA